MDTDTLFKVPMNRKLFFFSFKVCLEKYTFPKFEKSRLKIDDFTGLQIRVFLPSKMVFESRGQTTTWYKLLTSLWCHNRSCNMAPSYIQDLLTPYVPSRQLRSSSKNLLVIPHFNLKTYGTRSFSIAAPTLWNTLPSDIMNSSSVSVFKNKLKTFLFKKAFL